MARAWWTLHWRRFSRFTKIYGTTIILCEHTLSNRSAPRFHRRISRNFIACCCSHKCFGINVMIKFFLYKTRSNPVWYHGRLVLQPLCFLCSLIPGSITEASLLLFTVASICRMASCQLLLAHIATMNKYWLKNRPWCFKPLLHHPCVFDKLHIGIIFQLWHHIFHHLWGEVCLEAKFAPICMQINPP